MPTEKWLNKLKNEKINIFNFLKETYLFENNNDIEILIKLIDSDCLIAQKDKYVMKGNNNEDVTIAEEFLNVFERV